MRHAADANSSALGVSSVGVQCAALFSRAAAVSTHKLTAATDGQTGVSKHVGPNPKRLRLSSPLPHRASCIKTQVKRKTTTGVPVSSTDRLVAHVLAKRVRLAEKLGETTARPPG